MFRFENVNKNQNKNVISSGKFTYMHTLSVKRKRTLQKFTLISFPVFKIETKIQITKYSKYCQIFSGILKYKNSIWLLLALYP